MAFLLACRNCHVRARRIAQRVATIMAHDFRSACQNPVGANRAPDAFDRLVLAIAGAAEELQRPIGDIADGQKQGGARPV